MALNTHLFMFKLINEAFSHSVNVKKMLDKHVDRLSSDLIMQFLEDGLYNTKDKVIIGGKVNKTLKNKNGVNHIIKRNHKNYMRIRCFNIYKIACYIGKYELLYLLPTIKASKYFYSIIGCIANKYSNEYIINYLPKVFLRISSLGYLISGNEDKFLKLMNKYKFNIDIYTLHIIETYDDDGISLISDDIYDLLYKNNDVDRYYNKYNIVNNILSYCNSTENANTLLNPITLHSNSLSSDTDSDYEYDSKIKSDVKYYDETKSLTSQLSYKNHITNLKYYKDSKTQSITEVKSRIFDTNQLTHVADFNESKDYIDYIYKIILLSPIDQIRIVDDYNAFKNNYNAISCNLCLKNILFEKNKYNLEHDVYAFADCFMQYTVNHNFINKNYEKLFADLLLNVNKMIKYIKIYPLHKDGQILILFNGILLVFNKYSIVHKTICKYYSRYFKYKDNREAAQYRRYYIDNYKIKITYDFKKTIESILINIDEYGNIIDDNTVLIKKPLYTYKNMWRYINYFLTRKLMYIDDSMDNLSQNSHRRFYNTINECIFHIFPYNKILSAENIRNNTVKNNCAILQYKDKLYVCNNYALLQGYIR